VRTHLWRAASLLTLVVLGGAIELQAQSSMFGTRAVGFPSRWLSARARGTAGAFGAFDPLSGINPAALSAATRVAVNFVATPGTRHWETPVGDATLKETRFPMVGLVGPIPKWPVWLGINFGSYADRDFRLFTSDTIQIQEPPVGPIDSAVVFDTLQSLGGMNEIRLALAYDKLRGTSLGGAFYLLTGSSRIDARRSFDDSAFAHIRQTAELSFSGVGFALGIVQEVTRNFRIAASVRSDGSVSVKQDSNETASGHINLPYTFAGGMELTLNKKLTAAAQGVYRTWSDANSDLIKAGGIGSVNSLDLSLGGEYLTNLKRPTQLPIRLGARYAKLPFPLNTDGHPEEFSLTGGTGLRFANDRAGVDFSLERAWRKQSGGYKEQALLLSVGVTVQP
jgi:long-subunit fatty acid transport protein